MSGEIDFKKACCQCIESIKEEIKWFWTVTFRDGTCWLILGFLAGSGAAILIYKPGCGFRKSGGTDGTTADGKAEGYRFSSLARQMSSLPSSLGDKLKTSCIMKPIRKSWDNTKCGYYLAREIGKEKWKILKSKFLKVIQLIVAKHQALMKDNNSYPTITCKITQREKGKLQSETVTLTDDVVKDVMEKQKQAKIAKKKKAVEDSIEITEVDGVRYVCVPEKAIKFKTDEKLKKKKKQEEAKEEKNNKEEERKNEKDSVREIVNEAVERVENDMEQADKKRNRNENASVEDKNDEKSDEENDEDEEKDY